MKSWSGVVLNYVVVILIKFLVAGERYGKLCVFRVIQQLLQILKIFLHILLINASILTTFFSCTFALELTLTMLSDCRSLSVLNNLQLELRLPTELEPLTEHLSEQEICTKSMHESICVLGQLQ